MSDEIILYDLPSKGTPKCWSLNPWKARLALNYKGLPYKTHWLEYPQVAPTLSRLDIPPNSPSLNKNALYSIPAIRLPATRTPSQNTAEPKYIMDSLAIAHALESHYPASPSLHLTNDKAYTARAQQPTNDLWAAVQAIALPHVPEMLLTEPSAEYFNSTRAERFGMELADLARSEKASEKVVWGEEEEEGEEGKGKGEAGTARQALSTLVALLQETSGVFVQGGDAEPSFADFIIAACLRCFELLDKKGDLFGRVLGYDEVLRKHYEACGPWLERDD